MATVAWEASLTVQLKALPASLSQAECYRVVAQAAAFALLLSMLSLSFFLIGRSEHAPCEDACRPSDAAKKDLVTALLKQRLPVQSPDK